MEFFKGMPHVMEILFYNYQCVGVYDLINLIKEGDKHEHRY